jgi:phosphoribosylaminoimidazole-succinocarboxamide synthase
MTGYQNSKRQEKILMATVMEKSINQLVLVNKGKVRDVYDLGDEKHLVIVATDRVSAFDHVLPTKIPGKGIMLTKMSNYWFSKTKHIIQNHCMNTDVLLYLWETSEYPDIAERTVVVRKAEKLPIEAIVRGYITGSGLKEYRDYGSICGIALPKGLSEAQRLPEPIFTPSTKEEGGKHDENITFEKTAGLIGKKLADQVKDVSLRLYNYAVKIAEAHGIIIADTKFEFGLIDGKLVLIDELLTPDSSRFWPSKKYSPGIFQESFDKQYIRDYLDKIKWNHQSPAPKLPDSVVNATIEKYREALRCFDIEVETMNPLSGIC